MKIRNYNDVMEYPVNYRFLKEETKKTILKYFNEQEQLKEFYYKQHILKEQHKLSEVEAAFGKVEVITLDELKDEFAFITEVMSENKYEEAASKVDGIVTRIRMGN